MGNVQSYLKKDPQLMAITTAVIIICGVYYYRCYYKSDKQYKDTIDTISDIPAEFNVVNILHTIDINEYDFDHIPAENTSSGSKEAICYRQIVGDRRNKVFTYTKGTKLDTRAIIHCIGQISSWNGKPKKGQTIKTKTSTGTVFKVTYFNNKTYFWVITCAHAILAIDNAKQAKCYEYVLFYRVHSLDENDGNGKTKVIKAYRMVHWSSLTDNNSNCLYKGLKHKDKNDLAVLLFEDTDGYYTKLFKKMPSRTIRLFSADRLPSNVSSIIFSIYGFPHGSGEMYGMESKAFVDKKKTKKKVNLYVKRVGPMFRYTAIDTEPGQSGSAIFIETKRGYVIVGVHIACAILSIENEEYENVGVALTEQIIYELIHGRKKKKM
eukprot:401828_1